MRKHKILAFLSVLLVAMLFIPIVHADVTIDSYSEANQNSARNLKDHHPSDSAGDSASGQSFTCPGSYKITSCKFYLKKSGSPTGNAHAVLYAHSGTYGTSSAPTGSALATSDSFDVSTLTTDWQLITFTFTGAQQYQMSSGYYCIAFENPAENGATIDGDNYTRVGQDTTTPTHEGNMFYYDNGAWSALDTIDTCFYVYGVAVGEEENFFGVINQELSLESTEIWSLTKGYTINQQFALASHRTGQFSKLGIINLITSMDSKTQIAVLKYVFGQINQLFSLASYRTWTFRAEAVITPTFTIESLAQFVPSILYFFGEINQVFTIIQWNDLKPEINLALVLAAFAFIMAIIGITLAFVRKKT